MTRVLLFLFLTAFVSAPLAAQGAGGGASYVIGGIAVDTSAKTTYEARMAAYRIARHKAWPLLWARLTGEAANTAPALGDNVIEQMVAGIEIQGERFSTTRYIATLGVVFDRARSSAHFVGTVAAQHSGPMLLLPIFTDRGARTIYQTKTPWVGAWARFSDSLSPIDYVLASGSAGDNVLLTAYQTARPDRSLWRNILNRFGTTDVLVAEVRLVREFPSGPIGAEFIARHGPDAEELGRFSLRTGATSGLDAMLDQGVRRVDEIYTQALRAGRLTRDPALDVELEPILSLSPDILGNSGVAAISANSIEADVGTPDARSWSETETLLRGTPTVTGVGVTSLSLGGTSRVSIRFSETRDMLLYQLDQRGLRLVPNATGTTLRRRLPADVPIPPPVTALDAAAAADGAEVEGGTPGTPPASPASPAAPPAAIVPNAPTVPAPRNRQPRPATPPAAPPTTPPAATGGPVDLLSGAQPK